MRRRERRALKARWRGERWRSVPSDSVAFRYLERFHDAGEEAKREAHRAFIPSPNDALKGLGKVNAGLVDFVQSIRMPMRAVQRRLTGTLSEAVYDFGGRVVGIEIDLGIGAYCPLQSMVRVSYDGIIGDVPSGERSRLKDCAKCMAPSGDMPTP